MADLLIPDTNTLLDIVRGRAVKQGGVSAPARSATDAKEVLGLGRDAVEIGLHPLVSLELGRNRDAVEGHALDEYRVTRQRVERLGLPELPARHVDPETLLHMDTLILDRVLARAEGLEENNEDRSAADQRYGAGQPPSHKGGSTTHDTRILVTALRVASSRSRNTTWLLSRNVTEFEVNGRLHPDIRDECDTAGLEFARTWRAYLDRRPHRP